MIAVETSESEQDGGRRKRRHRSRTVRARLRGIAEGELGIAFVSSAEIRAEARAPGHRRGDDVLAFPLDAGTRSPDGVPRALGDVVLCPEVVGEEWRGPLVHGLLHLLGYEHGEEMERREREHAADDATGQAVALPELQPRLPRVIHTLRTQRNLWIHFALAAAVLVAAVGFGVDRVELMALLLAITFVLVAELVNTAIEAAVDVASTSFDPMAKPAKDIAAGAVLIASLNAVAVRYLVFSGAVADRSSRFLDRLSNQPAELTLVALALTVIIVIAVKAYTGRGTPLRGGLPSGTQRSPSPGGWP